MALKIPDAKKVASDASDGLFSRAEAMVKGFFSGGLSGIFSWGLPLFLIQLMPGVSRPITQALGGDELTRKVAALGTGDDGGESILRRAVLTAGIGAAMGATGGAAKGIVNGNGDDSLGGSIAGIGMALVAAAVVTGAAKNLADGAPKTPGTPALPALPRK